MVNFFINKKLLDQTKENLKETNRQIIIQTSGLISSAFVLVAALAWNDMIKEIISTYLAAGSGFASRLIYTLIVTVIAVVVTLRLNKLNEKLKNEAPQK